MQMKIRTVFITCLLTCFCFSSNAACQNKISVGEAFDIASKDVPTRYNINLENYHCRIYVNASHDTMLNIRRASVSKRDEELFAKLEHKQYAIIEFLDKRIKGKGNDIVTFYYID